MHHRTYRDYKRVATGSSIPNTRDTLHDKIQVRRKLHASPHALTPDDGERSRTYALTVCVSSGPTNPEAALTRARWRTTMTSTEGSPGRRPRMYVPSHPRALAVPPAIAHVAARAPAHRRDASPFPAPFPVSEIPLRDHPVRRDASRASPRARVPTTRARARMARPT